MTPPAVRKMQTDAEWLADYLDERAASHREDARKDGKPEYSRGLSDGYASAYQMAASWIRDDVLKVQR